MGTSLKGKNLLPEGADSCLKEQFLMVWKITFTILGCLLTTDVRNGEMEATPMSPPGLIQ